MSLTLLLNFAKAEAPRGPQQGGQGKVVTMWSPAGNWSRGCRSRDGSRGAKAPNRPSQGSSALKDSGGWGWGGAAQGPPASMYTMIP